MQEIDCHYNNLTALSVQGLSALQVLKCYGNQLNIEMMTELLKALPARDEDDDAEAKLYTEKADIVEGNCKDFNTPETLKTAFDNAKGRNWELKKQKTDEEWVDI